jgi:hypothetical protein
MADTTGAMFKTTYGYIDYMPQPHDFRILGMSDGQPATLRTPQPRPKTTVLCRYAPSVPILPELHNATTKARLV